VSAPRERGWRVAGARNAPEQVGGCPHRDVREIRAGLPVAASAPEAGAAARSFSQNAAASHLRCVHAGRIAPAAPDPKVSTMEATATTSPALRTGQEYREALRDGRVVYVDGEQVDDVTQVPSLGPGIDLIAEMFDAQFEPETEDATTYFDQELQTRVSRSWQAPTTLEELRGRRQMIEYTAFKTVGTFGRPPDLGPTIGIGLLARKPLFEASSSDFMANNGGFAANIDSFIRDARLRNMICAEVLSDPQADRSKPGTEHPGLLRVTDRVAGGVIVSGAKSVGSLAAQADEILFTNFVRPDAPPEAFIWSSIPSNSPGISLICREGVGHPGADRFDHPIASRGEECDQLIVFDDVFLPDERIFNLGDPSLITLYGPVTVWAHWHILTRLWVKAQIMAGVAQIVVEALGTSGIPAVRAMVSKLIGFEQALKAFVLSAENLSTMTEGGVIAPDVNLLTTGRLYGVEQYPQMVHVLQELCGQGLVMRFPKAAFDNPDLGPRLMELLPGYDITAMDKNRLMNFIWDLTSSSHAGRTELFENLNGGTGASLRERLYREWDSDRSVAMARDLAGIA
jgi:4-hydroxyphenylacetate 3-monooxygenase